MSEATTPRVTLFVCGEPHRGDDAAGFHALDRLCPITRSRVHIVRAGQLDVQHLLDLPPDAVCIVIDAVAGIAPGRIHCETLDVLAGSGRAAPGAGVARARSTHRLPLEQTLSLAALLRGAPPRGSFVGLGGEWFAPGTRLSPAVAAAIPGFAAAIATEVDRLDACSNAECAA